MINSFVCAMYSNLLICAQPTDFLLVFFDHVEILHSCSPFLATLSWLSLYYLRTVLPVSFCIL